MSKNVAIKEGDTPKNFSNVKKILINNVGGGSSYWVPEDETKLGTKHINKDGTYKASSEKDEHGVNKGWYGYSQVTVSGIGSATITPQEGDRLGGLDLDPNNPNNIEEPENEGDPPKVTILPSKIAFIAPPQKLGYRDGEKINISGSAIAGYVKDENKEWVQWSGDAGHPNGVIPLDEVTLEPDTAHFDGTGGDVYEKNGVQALGILCNKGPYGSYIGGYHNEEPIGTGSGGVNYRFLSRNEEGYIYYTRYNGQIYGLSGNASAHSYISTDPNGNTGFGMGPAYTVSGNSFQNYNTTSEDDETFSLIKDSIPVSDVNPVGVDFSNPSIDYYKQEIKVKWNRIGDGKELSTSFNIAVVQDEDEED